ncbi:hypothetical protein PQX77_000715 [Marasmius sp. AFHP31]|nr:hypothetical protein PQX77_000715 [Marasmius sp. AFHP31]
MPSFRALTALFLAGVSFTSAVALPHNVYDSKPDVTAPATGCDATCAAKAAPVPVIIGNVQDKISPMLEKIHGLQECKADDIKPIVTDITSIIDHATAQVKVYVDAKVDLDIALAAAADVEAGVAVSLDVLVRLFISLVTSVVVCIQAALSVTAKVELDACIKIFASLCISLSAFIGVCCQLVVGLALSLAVQLTAFVALCAQLGLDASVTAFLKVVAL